MEVLAAVADGEGRGDPQSAILVRQGIGIGSIDHATGGLLIVP